MLSFAMRKVVLKTVTLFALAAGAAFAGDLSSPDVLDIVRKSKSAADSGDDANAIAILDIAVRDIPDAGILFLTRGLLLQRNRKDDAAILDFSRSIELGFRPALSYASRGVSRMSDADPKPAIGDFDSALRIDPKLAFVRVLRGRLLYESGQFSDALGDFDVAIQLEPESESYIARALCHMKRKDYAAACNDCSNAALLDPIDPDPIRLRSTAHRQRGDEAAADADCKLAERLETIHSQR